MLTQILNQYPPELRGHQVRPLGNAGGFSGASIWKLESAQGPLCVRRWPAEHPNVERLRFIHSVQFVARQNGLLYVPEPKLTERGSTFCQDVEGRLWEVTEWMPGIPALSPDASMNADQVGDLPHGQVPLELLRRAIGSLAKFHIAVECHAQDCEAESPSPGLTARLEFCEKLLGGGLNTARNSLPRSPSFLRSDLESIFQLAVPRIPGLRKRLKAVVIQRFRLQPCLRDIWHDHILFENGDVSGIIDFGAVAYETIATDIARLLSSVESHIPDAWDAGIEAYTETRNLSPFERHVLPLFREATVVLSGFNWIRWLAVDDRKFEDERAVRRRLQAIALSLQNLK